MTIILWTWQHLRFSVSGLLKKDHIKQYQVYIILKFQINYHWVKLIIWDKGMNSTYQIHTQQKQDKQTVWRHIVILSRAPISHVHVLPLHRQTWPRTHVPNIHRKTIWSDICRMQISITRLGQTIYSRKPTMPRLFSKRLVEYNFTFITMD